MRNVESLRMAFYQYQLFSANVFAVNIEFPFAKVFWVFLKLPKLFLPGAGYHYLQAPGGMAERLSEVPQAVHFISRHQVPI